MKTRIRMVALFTMVALPVIAWNSPVAQFDFTDSTGYEQTGFTQIKAYGSSGSLVEFSATNANNVVLTLRMVDTLGRHESSPASQNHNWRLTRDMAVHVNSSTSTNDSMRFIVDGLDANTDYLVRVYSSRNNASYNDNVSGWWGLDAVSLVTTDPAFKLCQNNISSHISPCFELPMTTDGTGRLGLQARNISGDAYFNGLEIMPVYATPEAVLKFDINNNSDGFGPEGLTEDGYTALNIVVGTKAGSATAGGVTVTVTNESAVGQTRHRDNMTGENVEEDFIYASGSNSVYADITGLTLGNVNTIKVISHDSDNATTDYSRWFMNHADPLHHASYAYRTDQIQIKTAPLSSERFDMRYVARGESPLRVRGYPEDYFVYSSPKRP